MTAWLVPLLEEPRPYTTRCVVLLTPKVAAEVESWPAAVRAHMAKTATFIEQGREHELPPERLRSEGRHLEVLVVALEHTTFRLDGGHVAGGRFVCTESDASKKRRRADPEKLRRAAWELRKLGGEA